MRRWVCLISIMQGLFFTAGAQDLLKRQVSRVTTVEADRSITAYVFPVRREPAIDPDVTYYWFKAGTIHHTQGGYSGRLLNGHFSSFYLTKNLKEEGDFTNGVKSGLWRNWRENGILERTAYYRNGLENGRFFTYDDSGVVKQTGRMKDGKFHGNVKTYVSQDSVTTVYYRNGAVAAKKKWLPKIGFSKFPKIWLWRKAKDIKDINNNR
ncbi:toxin-antitoxin system YwqK family antitoxin [Arcticibacter sp.]|uniref:toxin-antitoxin system YwqK family antitoxin n=1 Tax=Arcticibacter sp. TaxID=1872630 RepID=UPI00388EFDC5